ncbi:MAG: hypothetical protein LAO79_12325 [Acidobacteriia bacterium]|nr:hypothetical protein [Terriglobia bacterium]
MDHRNEAGEHDPSEHRRGARTNFRCDAQARQQQADADETGPECASGHPRGDNGDDAAKIGKMLGAERADGGREDGRAQRDDFIDPARGRNRLLGGQKSDRKNDQTDEPRPKYRS